MRLNGLTLEVAHAYMPALYLVHSSKKLVKLMLKLMLGGEVFVHAAQLSRII